MYASRRPTAWFYVGLVALTLAWGPALVGFLGVITWGMIFIPLVFLFPGAVYMGACNMLWERPGLAFLGTVAIGLVAFILWPTSEPEPYCELVPVGHSGRMDLRFVVPGEREWRELAYRARNR